MVSKKKVVAPHMYEGPHEFMHNELSRTNVTSSLKHRNSVASNKGMWTRPTNQKPILVVLVDVHQLVLAKWEIYDRAFQFHSESLYVNDICYPIKP